MCVRLGPAVQVPGSQHDRAVCETLVGVEPPNDEEDQLEKR